MSCKTKGKTKPNTKNDCFIVRCERDWKTQVKTISETVGIPFSVFVRESVNKNISSLTQQLLLLPKTPLQTYLGSNLHCSSLRHVPHHQRYQQTKPQRQIESHELVGSRKPFTLSPANYDDNGQLRTKGHYKNGKLDGPIKWYQDNGKLNDKTD